MRAFLYSEASGHGVQRPGAAPAAAPRPLHFDLSLSANNNFSESSALISWGFQNLFFKNHPLFSLKHLTNQSKNAALRALDYEVHFLTGGDF